MMAHTPPIRFDFEEEIDPGPMPARPNSITEGVWMPKARYDALMKQRADLLTALQDTTDALIAIRDTGGGLIAQHGDALDAGLLAIAKAKAEVE